MSRTNWFNVIPLEIFDMTFLFLLQEAFEASEWKKEGYLMIENDMGKFEEVYVNFWTVFVRWVKYQNNYVEFAIIGPNKYFTRDINIFFKEVEDRIYSNIKDIMQRIKKCKFASRNKEVCNLRGVGGCFYEFKMCLWSLEYIYDEENETCLYFKEFHRLLKEANSCEQISKLIDLIDETLNSYGDYRFNEEIKKKTLRTSFAIPERVSFDFSKSYHALIVQNNIPEVQ
ncbi:19233_t:CDS:2 [Dentiscutata erythropus]|uniref:19233_t:CDS:1 n=1 Tax=Dentiscutata erythropus TaxID=1348616 RepID=A0A9N9HEV8_9GLOM|nr:19233_t:CDS:2 [Dentiscutata erythropus]